MIVLDTSFLVAALNERDVHHEDAIPVLRELVEGEGERCVLPEPAFGETVTVLASRRDLDYAVREGRKLRRARELTVTAGSPLFGRAWSRFADQEVLDLNFVDCAVLAAAEAGDAHAVATFDEAMRSRWGGDVLPDLE